MIGVPCVLATTLLMAMNEAISPAREPARPSEVVAASDERSVVQVLVHLNDAPTAQVYAATLSGSSLPKERAEAEANAAAQAQLARINEAQAKLAAVLAQPPYSAREIYRVQRSLNAIALIIDSTKVDDLRRLPGVKAVRRMAPEDPTSIPTPADARS